MKVLPALSFILSIAIIVNQISFIKLWEINLPMIIAGMAIALALQSLYSLLRS